MKQDIEEMQKPVEELNEQRKEAVKQAKAQIKEKAEEKAAEADSFITLSFTSRQAKMEFMSRFGYEPTDKFINGDVFAERIELIE